MPRATCGSPTPIRGPGPGSTSPLDRTAREEHDDEHLAPLATRGVGRGRPRRRRGARSVAHLLRARPRPHPARQRVPPPRRQDAGVRVPRRPPAHPAHPRPRGRPGRHARSPERSASTWRSPRRSPSATTAATARAVTPARTPSRRTSPAATTTPCGAPTSRSLPLNLCAETLDGIRNHSWSRPAPAHAGGRGRVVGRSHRLRVPRLRGRRRGRHRRRPTCCRRSSVDRCGADRSTQLGTFVAGDDRGRGRDRARRHDDRRSPRRSPSSAASTTSTSTCARPAAPRPSR